MHKRKTYCGRPTQTTESYCGIQVPYADAHFLWKEVDCVDCLCKRNNCPKSADETKITFLKEFDALLIKYNATFECRENSSAEICVESIYGRTGQLQEQVTIDLGGYRDPVYELKKKAADK